MQHKKQPNIGKLIFIKKQSIHLILEWMESNQLIKIIQILEKVSLHGLSTSLFMLNEREAGLSF